MEFTVTFSFFHKFDWKLADLMFFVFYNAKCARPIFRARLTGFVRWSASDWHWARNLSRPGVNSAISLKWPRYWKKRMIYSAAVVRGYQVPVVLGIFICEIIDQELKKKVEQKRNLSLKISDPQPKKQCTGQNFNSVVAPTLSLYQSIFLNITIIYRPEKCVREYYRSPG